MTTNAFKYSRYGNGYECSSAGDARFSAFQAIMPDGRSIEAHYQCDVKGYDVGGTNWRRGKGKPPLTNVCTWSAYLALWKTWAENNPNLMRELRTLAVAHNNTLTDRFAKTSISQARALAKILNT